MLEAVNLYKTLGNREVLLNVSATVTEGSVLGIAGTNGAGKSTLLRTLGGIYRADAGQALLDGAPVWEDPLQKRRIFSLSDDPYIFPGGTLEDTRAFYRTLYPTFDGALLDRLTAMLNLEPRRKLATFSKGMLRQAMICLAFASRAEVILFDETFDGLDPVMRQAVKGLIAQRVEEGDLLPVISSHNLRELEDIADHVSILHRGRVAAELRLNEEQELIKLQCAFAQEPQRVWFAGLKLLQWEPRGRLVTLTARGTREQAEALLAAQSPLFTEFIPLTLEEMFIAQMEGIGYDAKNILL